MTQKLSIIRTINFDEMRDFYLGRLRLRHRDPITDDSIEFSDFRAEIHLHRVSSKSDIGVSNPLRLLTSDVVGVSEGFRQRGVSIQVRELSTGTESFITDPDGNIILLVAASKLTS